MIKASVIVCSYNRRLYLERCLDCLLAQDISADEYEILVVDDCSTDGTWDMLETMPYAGRIRKIRLPQREGPSVARNKALPEAVGEIVIFVDSDAFARSDLVRQHIESHSKDSRLIVDGPAINISWDSTKKDLPFHSPAVRTQAFLDMAGAQFVTVNASCRREHLLACGGFEPDFSYIYGWEDLELGLRLRKMGLRRMRNRAALVLHCGPTRNRPDNALEIRKQCGTNAIIYYNKHPEPSVYREIRLHRLSQCHRLDMLCRLVNAKVVDGAWCGRWPLRSVAASLLLRRAYIEGLKEGIALYGLPSIGNGDAGD